MLRGVRDIYNDSDSRSYVDTMRWPLLILIVILIVTRNVHFLSISHP